MAKFNVGDRALHKSNTLDSRPVAEVKGSQIRLEIGDVPDCWVPARNYWRIPAPQQVPGVDPYNLAQNA